MAFRYVILRHDGVSEPHFDLMLETYAGSQLSTWRLPRWPIESTTSATRLRDHRRLYLDYEGEIGGHRGFVHRIASGTAEIEIGEGSIWTISILTGAPPQTFSLKLVDGETWELSPREFEHPTPG
jgi:hypothetical protein